MAPARSAAGGPPSPRVATQALKPRARVQAGARVWGAGRKLRPCGSHSPKVDEPRSQQAVLRPGLDPEGEGNKLGAGGKGL